MKKLPSKRQLTGTWDDALPTEATAHGIRTEMAKAGYRMSRSLAKSWPRKKGTGTIHVQIDMTITFVSGKGFGV